MATSGSFTFDPSFAALLDEAAERAGIDPSTLTQRHINSAKMSLNLMFVEWTTLDGDAIYRVDNGTVAAVSGTDTFTLPAGGIDIIDLVYDYGNDGDDEVITRITREEFLKITDKTTTGEPTQFYVDQSNLNAPFVQVWPIPDADITWTFDYMRHVETVGALTETMDVHRPWLEAVTCGLALRLAEKYNLQRVPHLEAKYMTSYKIARRAGSGNSRVILSGRGFGSTRTRRFV
jgi:hypothetical protein